MNVLQFFEKQTLTTKNTLFLYFEQNNNIVLFMYEVIIQYKYMVNNNKYTYIGNKMGQVQLTVKVSSNRTLPRFEEPILG